MIEQNSFNKNLSREEIVEIMQTALLKKRIYRILYGVKSLAKNPIKALVTLAYIILMIILWLQKEEIIRHIYPQDGNIIATLYHYVFLI